MPHATAMSLVQNACILSSHLASFLFSHLDVK